MTQTPHATMNTLLKFWTDIENVERAPHQAIQNDILEYLKWVQAEKARADAAEEREKRLKETLERIAAATEDVFTEDAARHTLRTLYPDIPAQPAAPASEITARPIDDWHEDYGDVLWWTFPIQEPPYCGSPLDVDWPDYHTHWTAIVVPVAPAPKEGNNE